MFQLFDKPSRQHFIDNGRVSCPLRRRDVEVDLCAGCRSLTEIDLDAKPAVVRCDPEVARPWLLRRFV